VKTASHHYVFNRQRKHSVNAGVIRSFLKDLSESLQQTGSEVSVVFVSDKAMRLYNRRYRGIDKPTDVLSFRGEQEGYLGDIVISVDTAYDQARRSPVLDFDTNIHRLLLHGFLHLAGYDHETDQGEMRMLERKLRRRFQC
jgi:probable rRNA maturation factor